MPRALLSVSDKTGLAGLGRGLAARGFELVSTGGTARALAGAGLAVTGVSDVTGVPEMMDGRVKTLHPAIHGAILARRDHPADLAAARAQGIELIDLVVVNLYPFAETASRPGAAFDDLVEQVDIGGPSLVRAAAKNFRDVLVVVDPADYERVLTAIDDGPTIAFRFELMTKAFRHTGEYDTAIAATFATFHVEGNRFDSAASETTWDRPRSLGLSKIRDLRYGENPQQKAAWLRACVAGTAPGPTSLPDAGGVASGPRHASGFGGATIIQGRELSYNNLLDLDAAARLALEFAEPAAVVVKHTNPCGAATGVSAADAYVRARDADSLAAFGGIVALNRPLDLATAEAVVSTFIEALVAPSVDEPARAVLARKPNMRVVTADFGPFLEHCPSPMDVRCIEFRSILGGLLVQERDRVDEARGFWAGAPLPDGLRIVTRRQPTPAEWEALRFAWRVSAHVKSNAVIFTDAERTLAIGAGQMSRVDAVHVAVMKARNTGRSLTGSVAASDAFFPFRDGLDAVASAGATAVVQPGGSVRDGEVIAAADEHGLAMVFTGRRHFRH